MRNPIKATMLAAAAVPIALAFQGTASATESESPSADCVTADSHETWVKKATDWYPAEQVKHQNNLAAQQAVVAGAQAALEQAQADLAGPQAELAEAEELVRQLNAEKNTAQRAADELGAQVQQASARKTEALRDIEYRQGLIETMQAKLPTWQAKEEAARDEIGKQQRLYRIAKNNDDQAGMDAAHAAAEAARADLAEAQAQVHHYTQGQVYARQHIANSQAVVDEMTALGRQLYPQYQARLRIVAEKTEAGASAYREVMRLRGVVQQLTGAVEDAQATLDAESAKLPTLEKKVTDIAHDLDVAEENAAKPVCDDDEQPIDEPPADEAPADEQPADEPPAGEAPTDEFPPSTGELPVQRVSGELPVKRISGTLDDAPQASTGGGSAVRQLASTGADDSIAQLALAGLALSAAGAAAVASSRRGRHARD